MLSNPDPSHGHRRPRHGGAAPTRAERAAPGGAVPEHGRPEVRRHFVMPTRAQRALPEDARTRRARDERGFPALPGDERGFPALPGDERGFPALPENARAERPRAQRSFPALTRAERAVPGDARPGAVPGDARPGDEQPDWLHRTADWGRLTWEQRRFATWQYAVGAALLVAVVGGVFYAISPSAPSAGAAVSPGAAAPQSPSASPVKASASAKASAKHTAAAQAGGVYAGGAQPRGGASYAGPLEMSAGGADLMAWNQTPSQCSQQYWAIPNGTVTTDSRGNVDLGVNGEAGSCVALASPQAYSSGVIEAELDFPAMPGSPGMIANWTSFWLTNNANWPAYGELDAAEVEPVDGNCNVTWHSGSSSNLFSASTEFASTALPEDSPKLTPGWHTVDIVYTKGYFAVYYDGTKFTSYTSSNVTGDPLNIFLTTSVAPDNSAVRNEIGGPPVNSSSSPATYAVKYVKVWSYK